MKKAIVLLMILMMAGIVIAADLPEGWTSNSDGTLTNQKTKYTYAQRQDGYYTSTQQYGTGTHIFVYNPKNNLQAVYKDKESTDSLVMMDNLNTGSIMHKTYTHESTFNPVVATFLSDKPEPISGPAPASASSPTQRQPVTSDMPVSVDGTTPTPSPTPTPTPSPTPAPSDQPETTTPRYGYTLGNLLKTQDHTYTPQSSGYYGTVYTENGVDYKETYNPETKTSIVYEVKDGKETPVAVKKFDENYGSTKYDKTNNPDAYNRLMGQHQNAPPPTPAQQAGVAGAQGTTGEQIKEDVPPATGTQPEISITGGGGPEEEKVAEGKPEEPEGTDAPIIPRVGGPNAKGGTTANPSGEPQYYVDKDGNIYGNPGKGREPAPPAVVEAAKTYGGVASRNGNTYTFAEQVDVDDGLEADYRTTTTVSITDNGEEGYTRTVDQTTEERTGLLERGEWKYKEKTTVSTGIGKAKNEEGKSINVMTGQAYTSYDKSGKPTSISTVNYKYDPKWEKVYQTGASVDRVDDEGNTYTVWSMGEDKTEKYYKDKDGKEYKLTSEEKKAIEKEKVRSVNNGMQGLNAFYKLGLARSLGRFMKAYDEYAGLRQYSAIGGQAYDQQVQERRAKIQQEFCIATGTRNCIVSKICEQKFDIVPGDTMAGRGPGGQFVTSARINGKRSLAVELEGLSRQQLIDMFGNLTVVSGRRINLTDPKFNPKTLEKLKLRLYHIQFLITNNADKHELSYNIKFKRSEPGSTSSYGTPVKEAKWYPADKKLEKGATTTDEIYKWSPGEYTDVCLTFSPPLPSGSITGKPKMVNEFCVPFKEDYEGPTTIAATLQEAMAQGEQEQVTGVAGELV